MFTTLIVFQVLMAAGLISIVLVQRGPGATMGAAFGAGASGTVFGSRGAGNFLTRTTSWLAVGFFGISLALAVLATSLSGTGASDASLAGSVIGQQEESGQPATDGGIESAIDDLDNPGNGSSEGLNPGSSDAPQPAEQQAGADEQPERAPAASETPEQDDGTLPEPPRGG